MTTPARHLRSVSATWQATDPVLVALRAARALRDQADRDIRILLAYARELATPGPYRLADLADATGKSISGIRTAYTSDGHIKCHLGPVFLVLQGREAALSMRELIDKLAPVIDEMYPDLDAELQRQHREVLRQATLDSHSRARVNGTEPAAIIVARRAAHHVTT